MRMINQNLFVPAYSSNMRIIHVHNSKNLYGEDGVTTKNGNDEFGRFAYIKLSYQQAIKKR